MVDLTYRLTKMKDTTRYDLDGSIVPSREYTFYLGKYGPFTTLVPLANFDPSAIDVFVAQVRSHLQSQTA